jgi:hypothetical protein
MRTFLFKLVFLFIVYRAKKGSSFSPPDRGAF